MFKTHLIKGIIASTGFAIASSALAEDTALVLTNTNYRSLPSAPSLLEEKKLSSQLARAGYAVKWGENLDADEMADQLERLSQDLSADDRIVILFSGHMFNVKGKTYLGSRDIGEMSSRQIEKNAVKLADLYTLAARSPGGAAVFLGRNGALKNAGAFEDAVALSARNVALGQSSVPRGVLSLSASTLVMSDMLRYQFLLPGVSTRAATDRIGRMAEVSGYVSSFTYLNPEDLDARLARSARDAVDDVERDMYFRAEDRDQIPAYQLYTRLYPEGKYFDRANEAVSRLKQEARANDPDAIEEALGLARQDRREVQYNLSILGFDPRGIDGLFGRNTRVAIGRWQDENRHAQTGYLTAAQLSQLSNQARDRLVEIEREAREREERLALEERNYWDETGRRGDERGLRTYLRKYPEGSRAEEARALLAVLVLRKALSGNKKVGKAWEDAQEADTIDAYSRFIRKYPKSNLVENARERIEALEAKEDRRALIAAAREDEVSSEFSERDWRFIEKRLTDFGFDPGKVDGDVTTDTRRAINKLQRANGIPVTAFLDRDSQALLFAGAN